VRKRKSDVDAGPSGKWMKVAGKRNVATPKVATTLRGTCATSSKAASAPTKSAPKAGTPPKVAAPKAAAAKTVRHAAPSATSGAIVTKVDAAGRLGAQGATKAGVLKIKSG
jgi:hypothetical protein